MAHVPDHNSPGIKETEIKVFEQNYYIVDDEEDTGRRTDYELRKERIEVLADDNGVFLESKENNCREVLSIATPEMAVRVAKYILGVYGEPVDSPYAPMELDESDVCLVKFLTPEIQARVSHELWRLRNHCTSPHGPVDANGAYELLNHIDAISKYLDVEIRPAAKAP
jgi:hypothetical protein